MPVLALLAVALAGPATAIAASGESTSGYGSKPSEPGSGTSPTTENKSPESKEEPSKSTTPTTGSESKSSTLPFTGFDLRWSFAVGIVLMGAGFSIVIVQRRRSSSRS